MTGSRSGLRRWLSHPRSVLRTELDHVRHADLDLNPADLTRFTFPLLLGLAGVLAVGTVPLVVIRSSAHTDVVLVSVVGSLALTAVCTAVVVWITATVVSGLVLVVFYRTAPTEASRLVVRTAVDSFARVADTTARLATLALLAGLVALAVGLPGSRDDELSHPVLEDLLAAQVGVLLAALGLALIGEAVRCSVDLIDKQSLLLAWPWALGICCACWVVATAIGPFETTRLLARLLGEWLPARVDGVPQDEVIASLLPAGVSWWATLAPLPVIAVIWAIEAHRHNGFAPMREFVADR